MGVNGVSNIGIVSGCGVMVFDTKHKDVLLGLRRDGQGWGLAGGKVESGETSYIAAIRELHEEFGIIANKLKYLCRVESEVLSHGKPVHAVSDIFVCDSYVGKIKADLNEMAEVRWFPLDFDFNQLNMFPPSIKSLEYYMECKKK